MRHAGLRTFRDMVDDKKIAKIRRISDEQGKTAKRVLEEWQTMEKVLGETHVNEKRYTPKSKWVNERKGMTMCAVYLDDKVKARFEHARQRWNCSQQTMWRLALYELFARYGFLHDDMEILRPVDRKALQRDEKFRRPLTHRRIADKQWREHRAATIGSPLDPVGDHSKGSSGLHEAGLGYGDEDGLPRGDPDTR